MKTFCSFLFLFSLGSYLSADAPPFRSHLFDKGTLVYSDDFDGGFNREWWQPRTKNWKVKGGVLIGGPDYNNAEEAQKALGRDHHLGLSPVIRLNKLPKSFVLHMRFKFEGKAFAPGRPKFDIGHHINSVTFKEGGYSIKLSGGELFTDGESGIELNEWVDAIVEFKEGELLIEINGRPRRITHEQVSLKGRSEITFKTFDLVPNRISFDFVRLWEAK